MAVLFRLRKQSTEHVFFRSDTEITQKKGLKYESKLDHVRALYSQC